MKSYRSVFKKFVRQIIFSFLPNHARAIFIFILLSSCQTRKNRQSVIANRDSTIKITNSFTQLFIDSTALASFMQNRSSPDSLHDKIQDFYNRRNYQYAWFFNDGMADYVHTFLSLQNDYIFDSGDSTLYDPFLLDNIDSLNQLKEITPTDSLIIKTELALTEHFFRYAQKAYSGNKNINLRELDWFITLKKVNSAEFLDSLVKNKGKNTASYEPVNKQYNLLKRQLQISK